MSLKSQTSIETAIILVAIISIALLVITIMFIISSPKANTYSPSISLYQVSVNSNSLTLFLSGQINDPSSITLIYSPVSNLSKSNTFNLGNCNYTAGSFSYTFTSTSACSFSGFQGSYILKKAEYNNAGTLTAFVVKSLLPIGYEPSNSTAYAIVSASPSIVAPSNEITATIETNMTGSNYSLSLGSYIIKGCTDLSASTPCQFFLNSSIGADTQNSFYEINAYVYNKTDNYETNTSVYLT